jgi:cytochrome c oxidase accessory protein FixG
MNEASSQAATGRTEPRDVQLEQELYAKRQKIYPRQVHGVFALLRVLAVVLLLGLYYGMPWVEWGGHQAVLFDLPNRKFYIFDWVFWPQDFFFLTLLLIVAAVSLFFFTALAGRVWCGYACPQTVWTEVFMWLERNIEGDRARQMKLDRSPWGAHKLLVRGTKHAVWLLFAFFTGFTFVGYFTPIETLGRELLAFSAGPWETFWVFFYGFATYLNAGWMREQVCIYMCPYARFQSAMFDKDTLIVSYDEGRGEPRGSRRRGVDHRALGLGDCIDCTLCVQVCPTGIDIRNGLQYQCIACAACIDACDDVMERMGYPKGLIRYTTENAVQGKVTRLVRPRVLVYSAILLTVIGIFGYALSQRVPLAVDVIRDRNALYRETPEGRIENVYTLKVLNMDQRPHRYLLTASGMEGLKLVSTDRRVVALGREEEHEDEHDRHAAGREVYVPAGEVLSVPVQLQVDPEEIEHASSKVTFTVQAVDQPDLRASQVGRFVGPKAH